MIVHHGTKAVNPNSSALNQTAASSVVLFSREDESRYLREMEGRNRKERMKQVRIQEKEASKVKLQKTQEKQEADRKQQEQHAKYQEYLRMKQEIEELKALKEQEMMR